MTGNFMIKEEKNIAKGIFRKESLDDEFYILSGSNHMEKVQFLNHEPNRHCLQFHFCVRGSVQLIYANGNYKRTLEEERSLVLYNPGEVLPIQARLNPGTDYVIILIPIFKLHTFFSREAHYIAFLNEENRDKKFYQENIIRPNVMTVLDQILNYQPNPIVSGLYFKAKALELLSFYFNTSHEIDLEKCPFLADEKNLAKIKLAKEIIIERFANPPTLQELADEIRLPINRLKEGFKQVYGDTVYGFLLDYKMDLARKLLTDGSLNVNEVGLKTGYSAASHFIAAFKKKYGVTPKKYQSSFSTP